MNSDKVCVKIKIFGNEYSFSGYETEEYIKKVCLYVDEKMKETSKNNSGISAYNLAVITAVNISDDYHKQIQTDIETKKDFETFQGVVNELTSKNAILEKENDYLRQVIDSLKERIAKYEKK